MNFELPIRSRRSGRRRPRLKALAAASVAMMSFAGLAIAQAGPAAADPTQVYVAVGSFTTQFVIDQFATDLGSNTLGSYDAINPANGAIHDSITMVKGAPSPFGTYPCSYQRPNGTAEGLVEIHPPAAGVKPCAVAGEPGADIARESSGFTPNAAGAFVNIPFAIDAVTGATGSTSNITLADQFTQAQLTTLYAGCGTVTIGTTTYNPNTAAAGQVQINLYVPQPGSQTLSLWAAFLGFNPTTPPTCVHETIVAGPNTGVAVAENDGTFSTDRTATGRSPSRSGSRRATRRATAERPMSPTVAMPRSCITSTPPLRALTARMSALSARPATGP